MFLQILRSFLGPFSAVLDFFATRTEWLVLLFTLYLLMYTVGRSQIRGIKRRTQALIEATCRKWLADNPAASDEDLYAYFFPLWEEELKKWGYLFILNKFDLLPVSVTPANVLQKIVLTPATLRRYIETGEPVPDRELNIIEKSRRKNR